MIKLFPIGAATPPDTRVRIRRVRWLRLANRWLITSRFVSVRCGPHTQATFSFKSHVMLRSQNQEGRREAVATSRHGSFRCLFSSRRPRDPSR